MEDWGDEGAIIRIGFRLKKRELFNLMGIDGGDSRPFQFGNFS